MGKVICAGLGPGDPELMSVRADRAIRAACHIAYFRKKGRSGQARRIVEGLLRPDAIEHAMEYPVTTELPFDSPAYNDALARFYDDWSTRLAALAVTEDVVVLCEGDPFFYGSFMHLHARMKDRVTVEVIPGIPGMAGCWTATGRPMTWGDDVLTVLTGTMTESDLARHMVAADAIVVMKTGRNLAKIRRALAAAGRLSAAVLIEHGTMAAERIRPLTDVADDACPYFAIVLVHGQGRRPAREDVA
ncbi:precorrin-2 C(20)-methyltransferase [Zavarzinia compransoris]|uniref:precorrin-2 C(20)-methyltransferase n=1 Tax=Zavarzinia marina TaxID=2911065 RepID=UPI001F2BE622|nr:precorrin-2 C(20)-methyltransferase [Zavarzinia marina]MCF4167386.1 precorrin-2 C(20)-methyltransferase [Zavarzinia marina]